MSIAFLYAKRFVGPITPTILALRKELHSSPYEKVDWSKARNTCAKVCSYLPLFQMIIFTPFTKCTEFTKYHKLRIITRYDFLYTFSYTLSKLYSLHYLMVVLVPHSTMIKENHPTYHPTYNPFNHVTN